MVPDYARGRPRRRLCNRQLTAPKRGWRGVGGGGVGGLRRVKENGDLAKDLSGPWSSDSEEGDIEARRDVPGRHGQQPIDWDRVMLGRRLSPHHMVHIRVRRMATTGPSAFAPIEPQLGDKTIPRSLKGFKTRGTYSRRPDTFHSHRTCRTCTPYIPGAGHIMLTILTGKLKKRRKFKIYKTQTMNDDPRLSVQKV